LYILQRATETVSPSPTAMLSGWPIPFRSTISSPCSSIGVWTSSSTKMFRATEVLRRVCGVDAPFHIWLLSPWLSRRRERMPDMSSQALPRTDLRIISDSAENSDRNMYLEALSEPMMPDLEEIPRLRKALGLTQTAIARLANVSQSTIVKIEKRQMNPSYDSVKRIMNALQAELKRQEKKALVD